MSPILNVLRVVLTIAFFISWASCGACDNGPTLLKACEYGKVESCSCGRGIPNGTRQCSEDGNFPGCDCPDVPDMGPQLEDMAEPKPSGCIMVEPEEVDFGPVSVLGTSTRQVSVLNCSFLTPLTLASLDTCTATSAEDECEPSLEFGAGTQSGIDQITIQPLTTALVDVTFTPPGLSMYAGRLDVVGNGGARQSVELRGEGDSCPQAVAQARVVDSAEWRSAIATIPLATVEFTAMDSLVPGGGAGGLQWSLVQRPANSTTTLLPGPDAPEPTLFLDLAGYYTVELEVLDPVTGESCGDAAQVVISALPDQEVHIQLVWDTPADADQTDDAGTDVDLHFLHPLGTWDIGPYDIYFGNKTADWGLPGPDDDPSLDIDDVTGAGPENINMGAGELGAIYQVGVYYYSANGYGVSNASIRVYIRGVPQFEQLAVPLLATDAFWLAATIESPAMTIVGVNEVIVGFPPQP